MEMSIFSFLLITTQLVSSLTSLTNLSLITTDLLLLVSLFSKHRLWLSQANGQRRSVLQCLDLPFSFCFASSGLSQDLEMPVLSPSFVSCSPMCDLGPCYSDIPRHIPWAWLLCLHQPRLRKPSSLSLDFVWIMAWLGLLHHLSARLLNLVDTSLYSAPYPQCDSLHSLESKVQGQVRVNIQGSRLLQQLCGWLLLSNLRPPSLHFCWTHIWGGLSIPSMLSSDYSYVLLSVLPDCREAILAQTR